MDLTTPRHEGDTHPAYANSRPEVVAMVPRHAVRVLDVGCSSGHLGAALVARGHEVVGLELDAALAAEARSRLTTVHHVDLEVAVAAGGRYGEFDCVVLADVLEHLRDPWHAVRWAREQLVDGGSLVISVPNVRHLRTFWHLAVHRRWLYEDVGIHDRTHLRFFARANLPDLLAGTDLEIVDLRRTFLVTPRWDSRAARWNKHAHRLRELGALQFVFRAEPRSAP